ncbi:hypothetical protein E5678_20285 [Hydrogenophaga sp. PAMC20947]|nr:hypothetical protein E5678_20285 [Hydrogenophaga sp. PAMC20947]
MFWASPYSLLGLLLCALGWLVGARMRRVNGVLEATMPSSAGVGGWRQCLLFSAITLGHVVIATNDRELERLRAHERVHVRQYERWGPLFVPAYLLSSLALWLRGRDPYWDNPFEVEARRLGGG